MIFGVTKPQSRTRKMSLMTCVSPDSNTLGCSETKPLLFHSQCFDNYQHRQHQHQHQQQQQQEEDDEEEDDEEEEEEKEEEEREQVRIRDLVGFINHCAI